MRVTKAIREYVDEEIRKKYFEKEREIGREYYDKQDALVEKMEHKKEEFEKELIQMANLEGFEITPNWQGYILQLYPKVTIPEEESKYAHEKTILHQNMQKKIREILFDLEMGETAKSELRQILDNVVVE